MSTGSSNNKSNNPFLDMFKSFSDEAKFGDLGVFSQANAEYFSAVVKKNFEAATEAAKAAADGAQAVAQRAAQIAQDNAKSASELFRDLAVSAKSPEATISRQASYFEDSWNSAVANSKEIIEICSKANNEAFEALNKAVKEFSAKTKMEAKKKAAA